MRCRVLGHFEQNLSLSLRAEPRSLVLAKREAAFVAVGGTIAHAICGFMSRLEDERLNRG